jgi:hypothetical protein
MHGKVCLYAPLLCSRYSPEAQTAVNVFDILMWQHECASHTAYDE